MFALSRPEPSEERAAAVQPENWLLYDGECPFCSAYVKLVRLRENAGPIELIDARNDGEEYRDALQRGFDLDEGMLLKLSDQYYHGKDCIHALAFLTQERDLFRRMNSWVFRSQTRATVLYPILRIGRNLALLLLGRKKLGSRDA